MNPLSPEQQVRMQLALTYKLEDTTTLDTIFQWVIGPAVPTKTIIPVNKFEVVKQ